MGRYYSGDIEGKFWFAVQSSNDASFFGGQESEPNYISYFFSMDDLADIKAGIKECKDRLGDTKAKLDAFFKKNRGYNNEMLEKAGLDPSLLEWYARLQLGQKIYNCVKKNGTCEFEAEI